MTTTQRVILNHLALLQTPEDDVSSIDAVHNAQSSTPCTPQRVTGLRNTLLSSTDLRSPFVQDLPPLIESDQENGHAADNDAETMSLSSSFSHQHHRMRHRNRPGGSNVDLGDAGSDRGSAISVRSTPASVVTPQQLEFQINGSSSTPGSGRVTGNFRQRARKPGMTFKYSDKEKLN